MKLCASNSYVFVQATERTRIKSYTLGTYNTRTMQIQVTIFFPESIFFKKPHEYNTAWISVYKDLNLEFVTKNSFYHEMMVKKQLNFELSRACCARSLVNCILSIFCRLYLLGELSEDRHVSIMWWEVSLHNIKIYSWDGSLVPRPPREQIGLGTRLLGWQEDHQIGCPSFLEEIMCETCSWTSSGSVSA